MTTAEMTLPASVTGETVQAVKHWSDELFSLRLSRPPSFRFRSGEFIMLGLMVAGKPLLRAYSVASPSWDDGLDFYSIKVQDGPLTSRLQNVEVGDQVILGRKPTGTLVLDALRPGKRLYMFSSGTGIAPFASLIREPEVYEKFEEVILTQSCRFNKDLAYGFDLVERLQGDPLVGEMSEGKLRFYATTTRENSPFMGRITDLIESQKVFEDLNVPPLDPETDRVMICGSTAMLKDTKDLCLKANMEEGSNSAPGDFVVEKAFAE
jgi:ferredoxin--NADP+ reductase